MDDSSQLDDSMNDSLSDEEEEDQDEGSFSQVSPHRKTQTSVIQSPHPLTPEITSANESDGVTHKRRELLSRRPSYRKILNELSSDASGVSKIDEEEEAAIASVDSGSRPTIYQNSSGQYVAIAQGRTIRLSGTGAEALQGSQTLTPQPGGAILQCAASQGDAPKQFFIQGGQMLIHAATGDIPAYQLRSPNTGLSHSIVMAPSPSATQSPSSHHTEEVTRKREVRLMKNREAARECRRKKKEYVKCLENRVAVLENQNKTLIEELKALKDIYCHKGE